MVLREIDLKIISKLTSKSCGNVAEERITVVWRTLKMSNALEHPNAFVHPNLIRT